MTQKSVDLISAFAHGATLELVTKREGATEEQSVAARYPTHDGELNTQLRSLVTDFASGAHRARPLTTSDSLSLRVNDQVVFASASREPLPLEIGRLQQLMAEAATLSPVPKP